MLLIHPPVSKPSEPPPGVALLAGALRERGVPCRVWDANVEALSRQLHDDEWLCEDKRVLRARRHRHEHLSLLKSQAGYSNLDRYKRAVHDLNRIIEAGSARGTMRAGLANLTGEDLLPVRSADLIVAAEHPERVPLHACLESRLLEIVARENPSFVGFSLNFMSQALNTFALVGTLRRHFPRIRIVLGGGLVTSWVRLPGWRSPFTGLVDDLVAGPGEAYLLSLCGHGTLGVQPAVADYADMPWDRYIAPGPILPYSASRGCYWNRCAFCPEKAEGNRYLPIDSGTVMSNVRHHLRASGPVLIHFLDNAMSPDLLRSLCRNPLGVPWYGFVRVNRELTEPDFCRQLRASGCVMLKLGVESGSQRVLDGEGKGVEVGMAERALRSLKEAGIATYVYLLFGTLSETRDEARETLEFTVRNSPFIDYLNAAIFNLPVNSEAFARLKTFHHYDGDLSLYAGFEHPLGWGRAGVRHFLDREFKRHPAIAAILKRDPPIFTSNHAPFFSEAMPRLKSGNP